MSTQALTQKIILIINVLHQSYGDKKAKLISLLETYKNELNDEEIYSLIDHYKSNVNVIEAVLASGILTEKAAFRMLRLFPRNERIKKIVTVTYLSVCDNFLEESFHETMLDGKSHEVRA
ncbi:MAG: hypothetical protein CR972_03610 [Candidatus Moraniibacteriota bacterium]|nr:MAG: hypothetical protein CR972_03610 [Candidatus Moranbacteria bacterium]